MCTIAFVFWVPYCRAHSRPLTRTRFGYNINHRLGSASGTAHGSCFSRFVESRTCFPASAFFAYNINHRPGFASGTAHGSCLSRFVVIRLSFPAFAFFVFDINHRFGVASGTTHGPCFSGFVVIRPSFPAPADSILRFHLTKKAVRRTPFRFSEKITVGCTFSAIQVLTHLRHGGITMNDLFFK